MLLASLLLAACQEEPAPPPPRPVLYVEAQPRQQAELGRFAGSIQARYESVLGFRVGGRIARRLLDVGDTVKAGQPLAMLDPTDQQNALRASQGDLARAEAQWINAQANARRQQALFDRGVGARAALEQAQTDLSSARSARDQAQAQASQARDRLGYSTLASDYDGVITAWHAEAGQVVAAGQQVVSVARPEVREAVFDLPSELVGRLGPDVGFEVVAQLDPAQRCRGRVRELGPQADPATRTRRVRLTLDAPPEGFHLGTAVTVVLTQAVTPRFDLPATAVQETDGQAQVWVIDRQTLQVHPRPVQVLARRDGRVSVAGGLDAGDRLVSAGLGQLKDGQTIRMDEGVQP
jgi:RND family efflux transporter MFP subunit